MAAVKGFIIDAAFGGYSNPNISPQFSQYQVDYWPPHVFVVDVPATNVFTNNLPVSTSPRSLEAFVTKDTFDDYYFHVRAVPEALDLGNVSSSKTENLELWNSFLEDVTVTSVELQNGDGLSFQAPVGFTDTPFVLKPNQSIIFTLSSSLQGPPNINANIMFVTDHGNVTVKITGTRVVLFPFKPDWTGGISETISARSAVARSADGTEQSASYRRKFRRSFQIPYTLKGVNAQRLDNLLFGWQSRSYGMPVWTEESKTLAEVSPGSNVVTANTFGRTFTVGGLVMIYNDRDPSVYESQQISAISGNNISLVNPLFQRWSVGSKILPVLVAAVSPSISGTRHTDAVAQGTVQFDCEPSQTPSNCPNLPPPAVYLGYEVYTGMPNWRDANAFAFNSDGQRLDLNTGVFSLRSQSGYSGVGRGHAWFLPSFEKIMAYRSWLRRRQGKTVGCWMPSAMNDFTCVASVDSIASIIPCVPNGYSQMASGNKARNHLYLKLKNGHEFFREIVSAQDQPNGTMSLQLNSTIGEAFSPKDIRYLSILNFYRMTDDNVTIDWKAVGVAESTIGLISTRSYT